MHWTRIKSILIAVFIIVDVYLLIQYFAINENTDVISRTTIENTISLLESKDITVPKDAIPRMVEKSPDGTPYKTGADALITFADIALKEGTTPCNVEQLILEEGNWIITTNNGVYTLDAVTLNQK